MPKFRLPCGAITLIDRNMLKIVNAYAWKFGPRGYVIRKSHNKCISLHRLVMNAPSKQIVDHINGDPLDNRKRNLRFVSAEESACNKVPPSGGITPAKGGKWKAQIARSYVKYYLGTYATQREALAARLGAEIVLFGDFRRRSPIKRRYISKKAKP